MLLDNGRTAVLGDEVGRAALHCIRCSACLNVCPVYERTGGHAYGSIYPGPIGAILSPQLTGTHGGSDPNASLPFASSLCGACYDVCPVLIDIPSILVHLRALQVEGEGSLRPERLAMKAVRWLMDSPTRFGIAQRALASGLRIPLASKRIASPWTESRDLPPPPPESFRQWWARTHESENQ